MRKMVVALPEALFKALKLHATEHDRTLKALVEEALRQYLEGKGGKVQE